jgi:hypothetical protein
VNAYDDASDPVYADGWDIGDNGGTGFTGWNFDGTSEEEPVQRRIDEGLKTGALGSSVYNDIGRAWSVYNAVEEGFGGRRDISRAGRGFAPLQVGQTLSVVVDNPTERRFFRGYFVRLNGNTGGVNGNICYGDTACTPGADPVSKMRFQMFDYFTYGEWSIVEADGPDVNEDPDGFATGLYDMDNISPPQVGTNSGVKLDITVTGTDTYQAVMTPLDNPGAAFTHNGLLDSPGVPIDWIEFTFFNTQSEQGFDTDFYIRSIEITGGVTENADFDGDGDVDGRDFLTWQRGFGIGTTLAQGDANGSGTVDGADLSIWQAQYGGSPPLVATAAIPEPACWTLFFLGIGFIFRRGTPR